jgi:hypothetical protein
LRNALPAVDCFISLNSKAAMKFVYAIAQSERKKTIARLNSSIFSVMMDGSTDISGDEQEAVYICFSEQAGVSYVSISSQFILFTSYEVD